MLEIDVGKSRIFRDVFDQGEASCARRMIKVMLFRAGVDKDDALLSAVNDASEAEIAGLTERLEISPGLDLRRELSHTSSSRIEHLRKP